MDLQLKQGGAMAIIHSRNPIGPSRVIGLLDERGKPANAVVEVVVAEAHGSVVEQVAELEHRLVLEQGVPSKRSLLTFFPPWQDFTQDSLKKACPGLRELTPRPEAARTWDHAFLRDSVHCSCSGWPRGNGNKLSNSQACWLSQLCLAAA